MLSLTDNFAKDIQRNNSTIYPLIIIDETYYISTIEEVIISEDEPLNFKDYGLKLSNIRESINIQSHSFKISNITLTLNNYIKDGLRLSDVLSDQTNKYVNAYYKTQSCKTLEDCLLIYRGVIKRVTHDDSKITLTVEDLTDVKTHKNVPISNLGYSDKVLNKNYINRPIPITYGEVDKAPVLPLIFKDELGKSFINIIADDVDEISGIDRGIVINNFDINKEKPELFFESEINKNSPLYVYKDDYFRVLKEYNDNVDIDQDILGDWYVTPYQYSISNTKQFLTIEKEIKGGFPQNPPASNELQAVKILRPSQSELLVSEGGEAEVGLSSSIINISPDGGILRPEAAIDNEENPTSFMHQGEFSEFTTFAQIPNNQAGLMNNENIFVNLFTNYNDDNTRKGILYPQADDENLINETNYLWLMNAWMQTNAHEIKVKFISAPPGDMIISRAETKLIQMGYMNAGEGSIFHCKTGGESPIGESKVEIHPQYAASAMFQSAWIRSCTGISATDGVDYETNENIEIYDEDGNLIDIEDVIETYEYFPSNVINNEGDVSNALKPGIVRDYSNFPSEEIYINNSGIFANPNKEAIYPSTIYKITCDINHPNNLFFTEGFFDPITQTSGTALRTVYVGQWNDTMDGALLEQGFEVWFNLFYDEDYHDIPFLFYEDDFAVFKPTTLKDRHLDNSVDYVLGTRYTAEYNGVPIGTKNGTPFNQAATEIKHEHFAGGYGQYTVADNKIYMDGLCGHDNTSTGTSGGQSWWMIIEEDIYPDKLMSDVTSSDNEYLGEFIDENCNTTVKAKTLIPCGSKISAQHTGWNFNYDYILSENVNYVNLKMGDASVSEERLSLFFPISDIASTDIVESNTFVYGKLKLNIPTQEENNVLHNIGTDDQVLVQAYATTKLESSSTNYNADFVGGNQYATNLINLSGTEFLQNLGEEIIWDSNNYEEGSSVNNFNDYFTNFRISDWTTPDAFNALSLVYRIRNNNPDTNRIIAMSTDIYSIGLLQYTIFKNVFDDDFYANVQGRMDIDGKYTNIESSLIENPADIMYHFIEKELGIENIIDEENLVKTRDSNTDINLAFSVKENVNSKKLLQDIAKNTRLFPRFNTSGEFSFSSINKEYSSFDEEVKQEDVISFEITRTPSEKIYTLINVKYKKDYAEDDYTRETGYCDGYDFFGNSENGAEVYKMNNEGNYQWDSNGYDYSFLGLEREDNILEFESEFIRTYNSAVNLRNHLYLLNCNQHTIIKCTVPLKYIKLQVGDVIRFDKLNNGLKAFGEDYTAPNVYRNGQEIYPFFIITSLTKSSKDIKIECMQLHNLTPNFSTGLGSLTRRSELGISAFDSDLDINPNEHLTLGDKDILENLIAGVDISKITTSQKLCADISNEGAIDQEDLNQFEIAFSSTSEESVVQEEEEESFTLGDINGDGQINIADVIQIVNYIISTPSGAEVVYDIAADLNESGQVNVADIVELVNQILEET